MPLKQQSGFSFPMVAAGPQGHVRYTSQDTVSLINFSIQQILLTMPGERFWNPTFGCLLRKLQFENLEATTIQTIKNIVLNAIRKWEPRVAVTPSQIVVTQDSSTESTVTIAIGYTVTNPDFTSSRAPLLVVITL